MKTFWKHWLFQNYRPPEKPDCPVSDHLRTHQGQSPQSLGTPRTAGRCNRAGGGLPTAVLYPSTKIERPKGPQTRLPGGVLPLELDALDDRDSRVMTVPDSHRPTHGPTPPKCPFRWSYPASAPKPAHRVHTVATAVFSCLSASCLSTPDAHGAKWVRASARKRRLAAACGKPNALLAPHVGK